MSRPRLKALFIKADRDTSLGEVCRIARAAAERVLHVGRQHIHVYESAYLPKSGGFAVVVEALDGVVRDTELDVG